LFSTPVRWLINRRPEPMERAVSFDTPWRLAETLRDPAGPSSARLPELARVLRQSYPRGRFRGRIFASEVLGDYLLWALPAEFPVVIYSHVHVFSPKHWH